MALATAERNVKAHWVPTIADDTMAEVTAAELTAGVDITPKLPTSGLDISFTQNEASVPMLDTGKVAKAPGTSETTINITSLRDTVEADDLVWETFERGEEGYLVISRFGAPEAGSRIEVYKCQSDEPVPIAPTTDDFQQTTVKLLAEDWNLRAEVVA